MAYCLSREFGRESFDGVAVQDVLGLLEAPWAAAAEWAALLKTGAALLAMDAQARPIMEQTDLWRFNSESYRALFHPLLGLEIRRAIHDRPCLLLPEAPDELVYYKESDPCFSRSAALAVKAQPIQFERFTWNME